MQIDKENLDKLSNQELFKALRLFNINCGPVTVTTRSLLEKKLRNVIEKMDQSFSVIKPTDAEKKDDNVDPFDLKIKQDTNYYFQNVENENYLYGGSSHIKKWSYGLNIASIEWEMIPSNKKSFLIRNKLKHGHLDGGPRHMRRAEDGIGNCDWISWKIIPNNDNTYFVVNVKTGGYLDGGSNHIRPQFHGQINPTWIKWRIKEAAKLKPVGKKENKKGCNCKTTK